MVRMGREIIQKWGFRPLEPGECIEATFDRLEILSIQGLKLPSGPVEVRRGTMGEISYVMAIGESINALSRAVIGDDWCEDEGKWFAERSAFPPYALIRLSKTKPFTCTSGYVKEHADGWLEVHEAFDDAILAGRELREQCLPRLATALASVFASGQTRARVRHAQASTMGTTLDGKPLKILKVTANSPEVIMPVPIPLSELTSKLDASEQMASMLDTKVAKFLWMGLNEPDDLRKFLFLFLGIEIETHRAFKAAGPSATDEEKHKTVRPRFEWCAANVWPQITATDLERFLTLHKARNDLAHGSRDAIERPLALAAEALAKKLHQPAGSPA